MTASISELSVLYVEDDLLSREVMSLLLERVMGVTRLTCFEDSHNFEARLAALPYTPEVFLLDIHMQPLSGFELLKLLRADDRYRGSTIIALTASVMSNEVQELRVAGFDGLISKPINQKLFPQRLSQVLSGEDRWFAG